MADPTGKSPQAWGAGAADEERSIANATERWIRARRAARSDIAKQAVGNVFRGYAGAEMVPMGHQPVSAESAAAYNDPILRAYESLQSTINDRHSSGSDVLKERIKLAESMLNKAVSHLQAANTDAMGFRKTKIEAQLRLAQNERDDHKGFMDFWEKQSGDGGLPDRAELTKRVARMMKAESMGGEWRGYDVNTLFAGAKSSAEIDMLEEILNDESKMNPLFSLPGAKPKAVFTEERVKSAADHARKGIRQGIPSEPTPWGLDRWSAVDLIEAEKWGSPSYLKEFYDTAAERVLNAHAATGTDISPMVLAMTQQLTGEAAPMSIDEATRLFAGESPAQQVAETAEVEAIQDRQGQLLDMMLDPNAPSEVDAARRQLLAHPEIQARMSSLGITDPNVQLRTLAKAYRIQEKISRQTSREAASNAWKADPLAFSKQVMPPKQEEVNKQEVTKALSGTLSGTSDDQVDSSSSAKLMGRDPLEETPEIQGQGGQ